MKEFLGYEWSSRKGNEGIKYLGAQEVKTNDDDEDVIVSQNKNISQIKTPLFNPLDFSRVTFDKAFKTTAEKKVEIKSKYPLRAVSTLVDIISGGTPDTNNPSYWNGDISWLSVADFSSELRFVSEAEKSITKKGLENCNSQLLKQNDIIISARGTVGAMAQLTKPMAFNQSCYGLRSKGEVSNDFIFYVLKHFIQQLQSQATGSKFGSIVRKTFDSVKIPVPKEGIYPVMGSNGRVGFHNKYIVEGPCIIVGRKGSAGALTWENENCYPIDTTFYIKLISNEIDLKFLFGSLKRIDITPQNKGMGVPGLNRNEIYQKKIPVPPMPEQQRIVREIEQYEADIAKLQAVMDGAAERKKQILENALNG
ncbi:MAG: restriction endonuclease subunit S [Spirochaetaceae bacterium]|jgi:restriction endonuclease S subunit|nr:restriction endonuclease subunit S [Spirochaetaceae bacterium]